MMKHKSLLIILSVIAMVSVMFTLIQRTPVPPCFNADEASFGYNAYSLLKTGKDEYGALLPLRLKSFGDFKMPLYSYLSIPFIAVFGLSEFGARSLNVALSFILPFCVFGLALELFRNKKIALLSAFLVSVSLGLHIVARHTHEAYLATVLTTLTAYFMLRSFHKPDFRNILFLLLTALLLLFSYHPGRLFVGAFLVFALLYSFREQKKYFVIPLILLGVIAVFSVTDLMYSPERLKNLAFFNNQGFSLTIQELKTEGGLKVLYNPLFIGIKQIVLDHLTYYSPQFLVINGDENYRFGYPGMSIMTVVEYLFIFVGLYFLFRNNEKWRWFLLFLMAVSPLSASLSWSKGSLTRSLFLFIPLLITSSYGAVHLIGSVKKCCRKNAAILIFLLFSFFLIMQWDFYLLHYPKRLVTIHAWQCGYGQVNTFIEENYDKYDKFYITRDIGMPYIFSLFYLQYPPEKYQKTASLTAPDEYGFGQVDGFDKFIFTFRPPGSKSEKAAYIGSVDNFKGLPVIDDSKLKTVSVGGEAMFRIYAP